MRIFICIVVFLMSSNVWAQNTAVEFKPPTSVEGDKFKETADDNRQRSDARYLHPDQQLDKPFWSSSEEKEAKPLTPAERQARNKRFKIFSSVILALIFLVALVLWWDNRSGGRLFNLFRRHERFGNANDASSDVDLADAQQADRRSLGDLADIKDPHIGLHELLVQALLHAADQNKIPLRRSLTTRDVLNRVPAGWPHRNILQALIARSELVLFGGRDISMSEYQDALSLAQPLFAKGRRR